MSAPFEARLRDAVNGTWLESPARFVWKRILGRKSKNDIYDEITAAIMRKTLRRDSNCIDVGCHAGAILDEMLALAPDGVHYAFEPLPHLAGALRRKYAGRANLVLHEVALSNAEGTAEFHLVRAQPWMSGLRRREDVSHRQAVDVIGVRTARLDAIVPPGTPIAFVKVDVEGAESLVFEGARECFRRNRPVVVFEHGAPSRVSYGAGPDVVFERLAEAGLQVSLLQSYQEGRRPLSRAEFIAQVEEGLEFYFVAHP
jgi:FkbM family methyltransferase